MNNIEHFSVLMSIYYKETPAFFNEAMLSVYDKQTLKPTEIILIKDGKLTDELDILIEKWQRILGDILKVVALENNVGTGKAKQVGLNYCSYNYVAIMDTDDISLPIRFEKQISYLKQRPDIAVLGSQILEFNHEPENVMWERKVPVTYDEIVKFARYRSPFNNMSVIYRKDIIEITGGYQHHLYMEDYNLFLRIISKGYKVENLPDVLVLARVDNGMFSRRKGMTYIKSEWYLRQLKISTRLQSSFEATIFFLLRTFPRLMPTRILVIMYSFVRKRR